MRIDADNPVESGQKFQIDRFRDEDAAGIANLFHAVYGPEYPFDTYYIPERIMEENHNGNIHSVVARTPRGDIVAHGALFRSSAHYANLYEIGQYIVLTNYRDTFAAYKINQYISEVLIEQVRPDGIFGEAVCNHVTTQKSAALIGLKDLALEVGLMPAEAYLKEKSASGRVSCLIQFRSCRDRPHEVFVPREYREHIEYLLSDCGISRVISPSTGVIPPGCQSEFAAKFFRHAGVARSNVLRAGVDFESVVAELEERAKNEGLVVLQFFLNLDAPWIGSAVQLLRDRGYFLGGYAPRWFDSDGLLMQKNATDPDFDSIALYSEKARRIKEYVRADWERGRSQVCSLA